jgi:1,4-alpha-glucan branching enzyme
MPDQPASTTSTPRPVPASDLARVAHGAHPLPHDLLGPHRHDGAVTVRTLKPMAEAVYAVLADGSRTELQHEHEGVWVGVLPVEDVPDYRLEVTYPGHDPITVDEPYRFLPTVGEMDRHLIGEGRHEQLWDVMGAHVRRYPGQMGAVTGTSFAVWAPHAQAVRVVGEFNHWDGRGHALRSLGGSGVWELFVPGVEEGTHYKFELLGRDGHWRQKADPMAYGTEVPPSTASKVVESTYEWQDDEWLAARAERDPHTAPMSAYEVHLGSWKEGLSYRELGEQLVEHVRECGFTHVELMPVAEHPYGGSWGYQITSYFAPTARFGHPDDFRYLVDKLHQAGIGVILDWVPAHFPRDAWALARFDGEPLYEYPDPRKGEHPDWGTLVFDYGRPEVRNFLVANALYWMEEFHIDGIRVDAVASMLYLDYSREDGEWVANKFGGREHLEAIDFLQEFNATAYKRVPGIVTIAEESTAWPGVTRETHLGGLGFGLKWNMGWMHDSLGYMAEDPVHRQYHHHRLTFSMMYAFSEQFVLPISHDEVVHGKGSLLRKMPGDRWKQLANIRAFLAFMWAHPGKQLLFMGSEFAQESEWAESRSLDWWLLDQPMHRGVQDLVTDLNSRYKDTPALHELDSDPNGFEWIDANDAQHNVFSFIRRDRAGNPLVCIVNFAGSPHEGYRIGLPDSGSWNEVLNTDAPEYGGSGVGNLGRVEAEDTPCHGMPASVTLRIPPLGAIWLEPAGERKQYVPPPPPEREEAAAAAVAPADASPAATTATAAATKKATTKKAAAKKATTTKSAATKTAASKTAATKGTAAKKAATKKATTKKATSKTTTQESSAPESAAPESAAPAAESAAPAAESAAAKKTTKAATKKTAKPAAAAPLSGPEIPPAPPAPEVSPDADATGGEQP